MNYTNIITLKCKKRVGFPPPPLKRYSLLGRLKCPSDCVLLFPVDSETNEYGVFDCVLLSNVETVNSDVTLETPDTVSRECKIYKVCRVVRD
jgi:hypothetical protein